MLSRILRGARALVQRRRDDDELDAELRAFLGAAIEDKIRAGMSPTESTRAARAEIGSLEAVKDRVRDVGWESVVDSIWRDVRYALRTLRRSPGFAATAVLTLSLGIGATTAIFSLLDAIVLRSLPVRNPDELVLVGGTLHYPVFQAFRQRHDIFVDLFATSGVTELDVEMQNGVRERRPVSLVSGAFFSTLGIGPAIGRVFTADDDVTAGGHAIAVASHAYWQRRFGRDAAILGTVVWISGTPITIVGVAPPGFFGEQVGVAPDLWVPLTMWGDIVPGRNLLRSPGTAWLRMVGRIRPEVRASGPHPVLTGTFRHVLTEIVGPTASEDDRRSIGKAVIRLEPAARGVPGLRERVDHPLRLLMGAVVLVLVIACANVANLLLARAAARRREIDVRLALGVTRWRLVRQLLTESLVLGLLGGAAGVVLAWVGTDALLRMISTEGSRLPVDVASARLLLSVTAVSLATVLFSGLAPAWQSARPDLMASHVARGSAAGPPARRISSVLVVGQFAVSLVLLVGAGLFLRTLANLRDVDLGFAPGHLLVLDVIPHGAGYAGERAVAQNRRLLDTLAAVPGVSKVSLSESGLLTARNFSTNLMRPAGFVAGANGFPRTSFDWVGPRYFTTIGAQLVVGRDFSDRDDGAAPNVIAINQEMARQLFSEANPIGRHLLWEVGGAQERFEIVAVVRDVKQRGPRDQPELRAYLPYLQMPVVRPNWIPASTRFLVRTTAAPATLSPMLRQRILSEDQRLSIATVESGPALVNRSVVQEGAIATLLVIFGLVAVGLACVGVYGLIAYYALQRTSEIGIRMALGARPPDVLWMMLRRALVWIAAGVAIGVPLALSASRMARGMLFGLSPGDVGTLAGAAIAMSVMGLLAAFIPARRASRIDPLVALRME